MNEFSRPTGLGKIDIILLAAACLVLIVGSTILFSIDSRLFPWQFIYLAIALAAFLVMARTDGIILENMAPLLYGIVAVVLVATLIGGVVGGGALRWLQIGSLTVQPSEFAKPAVALITAWSMVRLKRSFLLSLVGSVSLAALVFIQPDLGTTGIMFTAWLGAIIGSHVSAATLLRFAVILVLFIPLGWFLLQPYQRGRLTSFLSPHDVQGASYQSLQSMIAVGSGGLWGRGLGQGSQAQLRFLPARSTDFVFASGAEELGFLGAGLLLIGFFVLLWRIFLVFSQTDNEFARSLLGGIFLYLFSQVMINIGMNLGIIPIAGVPLPLVSAGGTALIATMMTLGMVSALEK